MTASADVRPDSIEFYRAIVEQMPDAVIVADRDGLIRFWNRGAEQLFGFTPAEALDHSLDLVIPEGLRPAHWRGFRRAFESRRTSGGQRVRTTRAAHKDGRRLYVDLSFGLILDAKGDALAAVAVGRDCTERYRSDKALRDRLAALEGSA